MELPSALAGLAACAGNSTSNSSWVSCRRARNRSRGPLRCAQTTVGRTQVILVARDAPGSGFWVLVRSSFAGYLTDWLLDAATEYL